MKEALSHFIGLKLRCRVCNCYFTLDELAVTKIGNKSNSLFYYKRKKGLKKHYCPYCFEVWLGEPSIHWPSCIRRGKEINV